MPEQPRSERSTQNRVIAPFADPARDQQSRPPGVHAPAQFVAGSPEGRIEVGFFDVHNHWVKVFDS